MPLSPIQWALFPELKLDGCFKPDNMNKLLIIIFSLLPVLGFSQLTGGGGVCYVSGDPNNVSSLEYQNGVFSCLVAKDTLSGLLYVYNPTLSIGSRWVSLNVTEEDFVQYADSLTTFVTPTQLSDSLASLPQSPLFFDSTRVIITDRVTGEAKVDSNFTYYENQFVSPDGETTPLMSIGGPALFSLPVGNTPTGPILWGGTNYALDSVPLFGGRSFMTMQSTGIQIGNGYQSITGGGANWGKSGGNIDLLTFNTTKKGEPLTQFQYNPDFMPMPYSWEGFNNLNPFALGGKINNISTNFLAPNTNGSAGRFEIFFAPGEQRSGHYAMDLVFWPWGSGGVSTRGAAMVIKGGGPTINGVKAKDIQFPSHNYLRPSFGGPLERVFYPDSSGFLSLRPFNEGVVINPYGGDNTIQASIDSLANATSSASQDTVNIYTTDGAVTDVHRVVTIQSADLENTGLTIRNSANHTRLQIRPTDAAANRQIQATTVDGANLSWLRTRGGKEIDLSIFHSGSEFTELKVRKDTFLLEGGNMYLPDIDAGSQSHVLGYNTSTGKVTSFELSGGGIPQIASTTLQTSNFTAVLGEHHLVNTTSTAITVTPPASPSLNDMFTISDARGTAATNNITINFPGASQNLLGSSQTAVINTAGGTATFRYVDSTTGWIIYKGQ
jgi:hypothetical protein